MARKRYNLLGPRFAGAPANEVEPRVLGVDLAATRGPIDPPIQGSGGRWSPRVHGVDREARVAAHIAFASPDCGCFDCRARRAEIALETVTRRIRG